MSMPGRDWFFVNNDVYPVKVFMFIGNRQQMFDTAVGGMRGCFRDPHAMLNAELFADKMRNSFCREAIGIDGECLSVEIDSGERIWIVRMNAFDGSVCDTVMLSHECLHAALSVMNHLGISENQPYEALCYLHESILKKFMMDAFGRIGMLREDPNEKGKKIQ